MARHEFRHDGAAASRPTRVRHVTDGYALVIAVIMYIGSGLHLAGGAARSSRSSA